jgi:L-lactate dehydrogenase
VTQPGLSRQIVLYDTNRARVDAQVLDLNHGLQLLPTANIEGSNDLGICADSDVVVLAAGARPKPGQTRAELAASNAEICKALVPELVRLAPGAIFLVITSPVDAITYVTWKLSGLSPKRVLGSGMTLDSARFRFAIAERCRVAVRDVCAFIAGEHGGAQVPLWSSATIGNVPLHEWAVPGHGKLTVRDRTEIYQGVVAAAQYVAAGKGATNYAIAQATARILASILENENHVMPVTSLLNDFQGINDVCLSIPQIVGRGGVDVALPTPMNDAERLGLQNSAEGARAILSELGY